MEYLLASSAHVSYPVHWWVTGLLIAGIAAIVAAVDGKEGRITKRVKIRK